MMKRFVKKLNNKGVTIAETLMAFLIVCIAITMLSSCVILAVSTINKSREAESDDQTMMDKFWTQSTPNSVQSDRITFKDSSGKIGTFDVNVNEYEIEVNDKKTTIYEFAAIEANNSGE